MLKPIRIDAFSPDGGIRVIDTIIIDPYCLPVSSSSLSFYAKLHKHKFLSNRYLQQIAHEMAYNFLSELEIQGLSAATRTPKNATGRVNLLDPGSFHQYEVERNQVFDGSVFQNSTPRKKDTLLNRVTLQIYNQLQLIFKQIREEQREDKLKAIESRKRRRIQVQEDMKTNTDSESVPLSENQNRDQTISVTISDASSHDRNKAIKSAVDSSESPVNSNLRKISIHIRDYDFVIKDSFDYDDKLEKSNSYVIEGASPVDIAHHIVSDLSLPLHCAVSITTCIVEQLNGVIASKGSGPISNTTTNLKVNNTTHDTGSSSHIIRPPKQEVSGAWRMGGKEKLIMDSVVLTTHYVAKE